MNKRESKNSGSKPNEEPKSKANIFGLLKPYRGFLMLLALATIAGNALSLFVPKFISRGIDSYLAGTLITKTLAIEFIALAAFILLFTYLQGVAQTYLSEKAARDLRNKLADKISRFSFATLEKETPGKLLTNLTSDIDAIKMFVSMGIVTVISSLILIFGSAGLLISIDWKLALAVLALLPLIGVIFFVVFGKIGPLFTYAQEVIDRVNKVISESIVGASLVRVFNSEKVEFKKFDRENTNAMDNGMKILKYFSIMIPSVGIIANLAVLVILLLGGKFVIGGTMTLGEFTAFNAYVYILIFPIIMLGFISNIISRAQASYNRVNEIFDIEDEKDEGKDASSLSGDIEVRNVTLFYGEKKALDQVSFHIKSGTKTAIIGPTAAGKTQLLNVLIGLTKPQAGEVLYDGKHIAQFSKESFHKQVAIVFQDSVMFNLTLRENIAFNKDAKDEDIERAIQAAELQEFIQSLPQGLDTLASERGTSLSGGQKQRIMLARALALNPKALFLDDFTARVDKATEDKILSNIEKSYPGMTIVSVTQKISSIERYDKVVLLMEGEIVSEGTHEELSKNSPEYVQIMESQKSTETIESNS